MIAISSILATVALAGVGDRNNTARFTSEVEVVLTRMREVQNQAGAGRTEIGANTDFFATRIIFSPSSYRVEQASVDSSGAISWSQSATTPLPDGITTSNYVPGGAEWGLVFTGPSQRSPTVSTFDNSVAPALASAYDPEATALRPTSMSFEIHGSGGHVATITVDARAGTFTRTIAR